LTSHASIISTQNTNNLTGANVATAIGFRPSKEENAGHPYFLDYYLQLKDPLIEKPKKK
jgi:hypothetical protein